MVMDNNAVAVDIVKLEDACPVRKLDIKNLKEQNTRHAANAFIMARV